MFYHTIDTCDIIYLRLFTRTRTLSFKKHIFVENKPIQINIIPFSETTFKIKVILGRTLAGILLALAVKFKAILTFKVGLICIFLFCIHFFLHYISSLKVCKLFKTLNA